MRWPPAVSLLLHLGVVALLVGWPALFERRMAALPVPDQEATVEVLMGNSAEQTGSEAAASQPAPAIGPPEKLAPPPPPEQAAAEPTPPAPAEAASPAPEPARPVWQSSTVLGDGTAGAAEIFGDRLKPAVGERGNMPPGYPGASAQRGEQGLVVVRMRIGPDGQVTEVQVLQSSGYDRLDDAARASVARWHFTPAIRNGEAVESFQDLPIRFRLN